MNNNTPKSFIQQIILPSTNTFFFAGGNHNCCKQICNMKYFINALDKKNAC